MRTVENGTFKSLHRLLSAVNIAFCPSEPQKSIVRLIAKKMQ